MKLFEGKRREAGAYAIGGAVGGGVTSAILGNAGLAVAGTAFGVGAAPVIALGAVIGLAAFGVKTALSD
jgi:hypothetical protein